MAGQTISSNVKVCATCDYYDGPRTPKLGGFLIVNGDDGKCYVSNMIGIPKKAMYTCGRWQKWGALR